MRVPDALLAALLAWVGYSILNISQAVQKIGLQRQAEGHLAVGRVLWVGALGASGGSFAIVFAAISVGQVAVVGALAGTGLVSLALFSRLAMGEQMGWVRMLAISVTVSGAALVALLPAAGEETTFRPLLLWLVPVVVAAMAGGAVFTVPEGPVRGLVIAGLSGFLGAWSQLFQKLLAEDFAGVATLLSDPLTLVWFGLSFASMVVIQFAYRFAEAIRIIPVYTALFIATPVIGGVAVFGEVLSLFQWVGVALILGGALVLGATAASSS